MTIEQRFSLGHTVMQANGLEGKPLVTLNFVNPDHRLTLPFPDGDWYLRNTAVPAVREGEIVICMTLLPGLKEYYRSISLIPEGAEIIEVEPKLSGDEPALGFPYTDPLEIIGGQVRIVNGVDPLVLVPTYTNHQTEEQAGMLGLKNLPRVDSVATNNKTALRRAAQEYSIPMLPGVVIETPSDINAAVEAFKDLEHGGWLKFATGSGGDLVHNLKHVSTETMLSGILKIRESVLRAFTQGQFSVRGEDFWPEGRITPSCLPMVFESDARNLGEVLINGSNHFTTTRDGGVSNITHFRQIITDDGEYLGSRTYIPPLEVKKILDDVVFKVARYNMTENKFFGIQGVDWFLLRDNSGRLSVQVVELNSRPIVSSLPVIIAEKKGAESWINTNIYTNTEMNDISDFVSTIGEDLAYGSPDQGIVIPQSFRSLVTRRKVVPSPNLKVLVMANSPQKCDEVVSTLKKRGVRFSP